MNLGPIMLSASQTKQRGQGSEGGTKTGMHMKERTYELTSLLDEYIVVADHEDEP